MTRAAAGCARCSPRRYACGCRSCALRVCTERAGFVATVTRFPNEIMVRLHKCIARRRFSDITPLDLGGDVTVRPLIVAIVVVPLAFGSLPALAQGNPSADQIINSLRPSGNMMPGGTRGIRLAAPTNEPTAQQPAPSQAQQPRVSHSSRASPPTSRRQRRRRIGSDGEPDGEFRQRLGRTDARCRPNAG